MGLLRVWCLAFEGDDGWKVLEGQRDVIFLWFSEVEMRRRLLTVTSYYLLLLPKYPIITEWREILEGLEEIGFRVIANAVNEALCVQVGLCCYMRKKRKRCCPCVV